MVNLKLHALSNKYVPSKEKFAPKITLCCLLSQQEDFFGLFFFLRYFFLCASCNDSFVHKLLLKGTLYLAIWISEMRTWHYSFILPECFNFFFFLAFNSAYKVMGGGGEYVYFNQVWFRPHRITH